MDALRRTTTEESQGLREIVKEPGAGYAGDVLPQDAYAFLSRNAAVLVDVRTQPEWQFVGMPNLVGTPSTMVPISWKIYPQFNVNPQFVDQLRAASIKEETPVFFICRTGGRSTDAAIAATAAGYKYAFNIAHGAEGDINERGIRGAVNGWKAANLPWEQK